jgi:hypothetical protein
MNGGQLHRAGTLVFSVAMMVIGLGLLAQVLAGHTNALAPRLLLSVLFLAAGVGRVYLVVRKGREG